MRKQETKQKLPHTHNANRIGAQTHTHTHIWQIKLLRSTYKIWKIGFYLRLDQVLLHFNYLKPNRHSTPPQPRPKPRQKEKIKSIAVQFNGIRTVKVFCIASMWVWVCVCVLMCRCSFKIMRSALLCFSVLSTERSL